MLIYAKIQEKKGGATFCVNQGSTNSLTRPRAQTCLTLAGFHSVRFLRGEPLRVTSMQKMLIKKV